MNYKTLNTRHLYNPGPIGDIARLLVFGVTPTTTSLIPIAVKRNGVQCRPTAVVVKRNGHWERVTVGTKTEGAWRR